MPKTECAGRIIWERLMSQLIAHSYSVAKSFDENAIIPPAEGLTRPIDR